MSMDISRRHFVQMAAGAVAASALQFQAADAQSGSSARSDESTPHPLGGNKHLFIDDWLTSESKDVSLTVNPPQRMGAALIAEKPWERGGLTSYANVLWDPQLREYRMYYVPIAIKPQTRWCLALATSKDGIQWEKPDLGVVDRDGSKKNNIVIEQQREGTVIIDPNAPPERRYAYLTTDGDGAWLFTSPDGVRFQKKPEPLSKHHSDSQLSTFWDDQRKKYVHCFKVYQGEKDQWYKDPQIKLGKNIQSQSQSEPFGRSTGRIETATMDETWNQPFLVILARDNQDPPGMDLYTNSCQKYALAPDVYVAFPTPYYHYNHPSRKYLNDPALKLGGKSNDGTLDTQLAISRDGVAWTRLRTPYVPMHREEGLDIKVNMVFPGLLYHDDRIDHFYAGYAFTHGDTTGRDRFEGKALGGYYRVSQRVDGFMSADFAYGGGRLVTRPFTFDGSRLRLNVNTSASGEGRVALLDAAGKAIDGFAIDDCHFVNGDYPGAIVQWNKGADVSALAGKPIRLAFEMRGTKLYSFQFGAPEKA
jgi:hypothetical protein